MGKSIQIGLFEKNPQRVPIQLILRFTSGVDLINNRELHCPDTRTITGQKGLPDFIKGADRLIAITGSVSKKVSTGI